MKKTILLAVLSFCTLGPAGFAAPSKAAPAAGVPESYTLAVRDLVGFSVLNEPETIGEQRIDGQGRIRVPYIGTVSVAGLTVREAEEVIGETYIRSDIYIRPQITVRVIEYAVRNVSVLGEVNQPGNIAFPIEAKGLDIREVISQAGGFTNIARSGEVIVTRETAGKKSTFEVDVDEMLKRGNADDVEIFLVRAGDVVFVPERFF